jgi:membrane-associated protein
VLAVSALHQYGMGHHSGIARHYWMPAVIIVAVLAGLGTWWWRRRKRVAAA